MVKEASSACTAEVSVSSMSFESNHFQLAGRRCTKRLPKDLLVTWLG